MLTYNVRVCDILYDVFLYAVKEAKSCSSGFAGRERGVGGERKTCHLIEKGGSDFVILHRFQVLARL